MDDESQITARLPLELEEAIFVLSAVSRPVSIPNLILVAWRVKHWVEPLLYRTLVINAAPIDDLPSCSVDAFIGITRTNQAMLLKSVRNLMLRNTSSDDAESIISACSGVQNLYITNVLLHTSTRMYFPGHDTMPLTRLYCDRGDIFVPHYPRFAHPLFANITHLELFHLDNESRKGLALLPRLTHLAYADDINSLWPWKQLLEECKSLRVLICVCWPLPRHDPPVVEDPRFVMMLVEGYIADWQRGILTGRDFWTRAEEFIAKRTSSQTNPEAEYPYYLEEGESL
ncbi:hypothetical protein B0H11DRAFT_2195509 [Mycena galericulata]|nr:hypothetical protein B0H11DRAFT_2195509 [Mycena galericulata]